MSKAKFTYPLPVLLLLILLGLLIIFGILPGYLQGGKWQWLELGTPSNTPQLNRLRQEGITLTGWEKGEGRPLNLGGKTWLWQTFTQGNTTIDVILRPQPYYTDKPSVEWTDLQNLDIKASYCLEQMYEKLNAPAVNVFPDSQEPNLLEIIRQEDVSRDTLEKIINSLPSLCHSAFGINRTEGKNSLIPRVDPQNWDTDAPETFTFTNDAGKNITVLLQRGWNEKQTVAMVNWYSWHGGGNYQPENWFFHDLFAQLKQQRVGWVAVSLRIPLSPLAEITPIIPQAQTLSREVQRALEQSLQDNR
ncbi:MAG: cyanoexosortase B system-associated protein [Cyanobacterium sp. T60_A2020_053]|nr:cyanoexosortase B system-associated protein [Cyanobacterium sp. T60_A2020_053]